MSSSIIALLTDFGTRDPYVAEMKGVMLSHCDAALVDLTHEIAPFDIFEAAMFLRDSVPYFPTTPDRCTIFVAVVDPGVGSSRRILAAIAGGRYFLAPDNGLIPLLLGGDAIVHSVENETFFLPGGGSTFHGRDRIAPAAAALANKAALIDLGPEIPVSSIVTLPYRPPVVGPEHIEGTVVSIDRFGNLVTDIAAAAVGNWSTLRLTVNSLTIRGLARTYAERKGSEEPFVIVGSRGTLEISMSEQSAADNLQIARFDRVTVTGERSRE